MPKLSKASVSRFVLQEGFTLIELLVVMVIIGLLVALVGPNVIGQGEKAKPKAARAQIANFVSALEMFKMEIGRYPTEEEGLEALHSRPPGAEKWDGPYLAKNVPKDPWDHPYVYHNSGNHYEVMSYGADGVPGGSGLDADVKSS
ncbi:MAG: type II secretion system major pseudopilin GspG [Deltaproteobacteria bacterium]|nr:type II secretion system major pseudopilin GspG [Deltaproteobacteria bacterium]